MKTVLLKLNENVFIQAKLRTNRVLSTLPLNLTNNGIQYIMFKNMHVKKLFLSNSVICKGMFYFNP